MARLNPGMHTSMVANPDMLGVDGLDSRLYAWGIKTRQGAIWHGHYAMETKPDEILPRMHLPGR
jgi:hypothetical protein